MLDKLHWKVINDCEFHSDGDFLETILLNDGIPEDEIPDFLEPTAKEIWNPFLMENMSTGVAILNMALFSNEPKIYIQVDPDVDGYTSAAYLAQFLMDIKPTVQLEFGFHYEKVHGLEDLGEHCKDFNLIIVPDAGSNEAALHRRLIQEYGVPILILDHHDIEPSEIEEQAFLINCRDGVYPNSCLAGVGVVQKFVEAYAKKYPLDEIQTDKYLDLVALGCIADGMDLRSLETRYYVLTGLDEFHRENKFIEEMSLRFADDMKLGHTIRNYGWVIAPKMNGCIRYGTPEEQRDLFDALRGVERSVEYKPRRKSKLDPEPQIEIQSLQKAMARICSNVKSRQDSAVRKAMEKLDAKIQAEKLDGHSILVVDASDMETKSTVTGLVAAKLATKYTRPTLVLRKSKVTGQNVSGASEVLLRGSARGYTYGGVDDLKKLLLDSGCFQMCAGHPNSFGVALRAENLDNVLAYCDSILPADSFQTVYTVDYEVSGRKLTKRDVERVANSYAIWGNNTVPEPLFAITDIELAATEISGGETGLFIRFTFNGVDYIKKYCRKDEFGEITLRSPTDFGVNKKRLKLTVLGNFSLNEWEGVRYPQVVIQHWYSEELTMQNVSVIDDDFIF